MGPLKSEEFQKLLLYIHVNIWNRDFAGSIDITAQLAHALFVNMTLTINSALSSVQTYQ